MGATPTPNATSNTHTLPRNVVPKTTRGADAALADAALADAGREVAAVDVGADVATNAAAVPAKASRRGRASFELRATAI